VELHVYRYMSVLSRIYISGVTFIQIQVSAITYVQHLQVNGVTCMKIHVRVVIGMQMHVSGVT